MPEGSAHEVLRQLGVEQALLRVSPNTLYVEATLGLLNPAGRSFGLLLPSHRNSYKLSLGRTQPGIELGKVEPPSVTKGDRPPFVKDLSSP